MKALVCHDLTGVEGLKLEEAWPDPKAGPGEVVVDVKATALNFPDVLMIKGLYQTRPPVPFVTGMELAGVVREVGAGVTRFRPGDRVVSYAGFGAAAEGAALKEGIVLPMPRNVDFATASGLCVTYFTSYHALKQRAELAPGETVLVLGAGGGVGTTAVELAKVMGAKVIAAASSDAKLELARHFGADHLVNYATEDLRGRLKEITGGAGVDVVYDPVGGAYTEPALRNLAWKGRYLVIGFAAGEIPKLPANLVLLKGSALVGVFWGSFAQREPQLQQQNAREIWDMIESGRLRPTVGERFRLEDYARAFAALENRSARGKVVLEVSG
jgi:NADPH2:quinone reductase